MFKSIHNLDYQDVRTKTNTFYKEGNSFFDVQHTQFEN